MSLTERSASELLELLAAARRRRSKSTQAYLDRIARRRRKIGAFLRVDADRALAQAADVDRQARRPGEPLGSLAGLPVAVKDVLCDRETLTTCASRMLENFRPPYDATVVAQLKAADAVLIGRTNMDEFAMGGSTENSAFQATRNPWDLDAHARRLQRRLGGVPSPPAWRRWPSAPTPAARSANPPASAASSA